MSKTMKAVFGLEDVVVTDCSKYYKDLNGLEVIDSDIAVGIEVEVENNVLNKNPDPHVWLLKGDGSLRNNGIEYITSPISARYAPAALKDLLSESLGQACCFSPRTSIHVHVDMQKKESNQVADVILLYTLFEELFYQFTGRGRIKNIYCVPVFDTTLLLGKMSGTTINRLTELWSKYSGLNICRLRDLGTIEFRHMHGTFDAQKVSVWVRLICKLIHYAEKVGTEFVRKLCQNGGDYADILEVMFGSDMKYLKYNSPSDIRRGIDCVKTAFVTYPVMQQFRLNAQNKTGAYFNTKEVR